ncbi:hypothetical protein A6R70_14700 [Agrobacterium rubi]|uniref:hypothetical protein n=1 Tax=Agrobacterium rubi TaxID=28099 RepID=UPI00201B7352|nr:hypothetical protein [Agrobacterium rubi]MCL6653538.1 hypothetical protein [Agrobacterium rubi]
MSDIVERLRSNQPLVICPYDSKSPEYWTTPDDTPCKFCGGLPDGPDKCTGADTRIMGQAADEITRLRTLLSQSDQREKDARRVAIEDAAKVAILTANHLTILPPNVRKFPEVGGIMAARILELRSPVEEKIDEVAG